MARIFSVTLNAAIDHIVSVRDFRAGGIFSAEQGESVPAGKGINVARAISANHHTVDAFALIGASALGRFEEVNSEFLHVHLVLVPGATRRNITIFNSSDKEVTHIRSQGFTATPDDVRKVKSDLIGLVSPGDYVVIAGSLPRGVDSGAYADFIRLLKERGAYVLLDTSGEPLRYALNARPDAIKPNLKELEECMGRPLPSREEIVKAARAVCSVGVKEVIVSMGGRGALLVAAEEHHVWHGFVDQAEQMTGRTGIGSGDSLVAGYVLGLRHGFSRKEALRNGVAFGASNLETLVPGLCPPEAVDRYLRRTTVETAEVE